MSARASQGEDGVEMNAGMNGDQQGAEPSAGLMKAQQHRRIASADHLTFAQ
jgi:hypothetical protein